MSSDTAQLSPKEATQGGNTFVPHDDMTHTLWTVPASACMSRSVYAYVCMHRMSIFYHQNPATTAYLIITNSGKTCNSMYGHLGRTCKSPTCSPTWRCKPHSHSTINALCISTTNECMLYAVHDVCRTLTQPRCLVCSRLGLPAPAHAAVPPHAPQHQRPAPATCTHPVHPVHACSHASVHAGKVHVASHAGGNCSFSHEH